VILHKLTGPNTIICLAIYAVVVTVIAPSTLAQAIEFRFAPDEGVEEHRIKVSRVTQLEGEDDQVDELEKVVRVERRKTAGGVTLTERLVSAQASHDGESTDNPILAALREVDIVKEVSEGGAIRNVRGYERVLEVIEAKFPEEVAAELSAAIDADAMADQEKSEWEATVGRFAGRQAQIGDIWNSSETFSLDGQGDGSVLATIRFARFVPCGGRHCVQLDMTFGSGGEAAGREVSNVFEDSAHSKGQWVGQTGSAVTSVSGKGERVVDPSTMDLVSEKIERTIRIEVDVPGEGKLPMVIRERSETLVTRR
jgi:hypothetical protein